MKETWKPIFEVYEVSNRGRVRRAIGGKGAHAGRILNGCSVGGYRQVRISTNGNEKDYFVHVLVAAAFLGPCPEGKEVNHKDLDKANNHDWNLEYITHAKNMQHAYRSGKKFGFRSVTHYGRPGESNGGAKLTLEQALEVRRLRVKFNFSLEYLARKFGIAKCTVWEIGAGKAWTTSVPRKR